MSAVLPQGIRMRLESNVLHLRSGRCLGVRGKGGHSKSHVGFSQDMLCPSPMAGVKNWDEVMPWLE